MACAGKGPRTWSPDDDDMVPEYYRQWAATIERLGPEEQARTLGQMTEDDRLVVQRIIDQSSVRRSSAKRLSPASARPPARHQPQRSGSSEAQISAAPRPAPPRPPHRTRSAETLPQPSPAGRAGSGGLERPQRSSSYNLGTASSNGEEDAFPTGSAAATPERAAPVGTPPRPPARSSPSPQRPAPAPQKQADLLGLFGGGDAQPDELTAPSPQPAGSSRAGSAGDLFDMDDAGSSPAPHNTAAQGNDVDILGMFASAPPAAAAEPPRPQNHGAASAPAAASKTAASGLDELFGAHKAGTSMIDFGDEAPGVSAASNVKFTAPGDVDVEGEPEVGIRLYCPFFSQSSVSSAHVVGPWLPEPGMQSDGCCACGVRCGGSCAPSAWRRSRRRYRWRWRRSRRATALRRPRRSARCSCASSTRSACTPGSRSLSHPLLHTASCAAHPQGVLFGPPGRFCQPAKLRDSFSPVCNLSQSEFCCLLHSFGPEDDSWWWTKTEVLIALGVRRARMETFGRCWRAWTRCCGRTVAGRSRP